LITRALDEPTWPDFAALVERHNPEDVEGRSVSGSFLHNGTVAMFEQRGFERTRRIGKHQWVVAKTVRPWS
jgi:hypothetical protein